MNKTILTVVVDDNVKKNDLSKIIFEISKMRGVFGIQKNTSDEFFADILCFGDKPNGSKKNNK